MESATARREILAGGSNACRKFLRFNSKSPAPILPDTFGNGDVSIYFLGSLILKVSSYCLFFYLFLFSVSNSISLKVRFKRNQMSTSSSWRLHTHHEKHWADEVFRLHTRLLAMNDVRGYNTYITNNFITFNGVIVHRFLDRGELEELRMRASPLNLVNADED